MLLTGTFVRSLDEKHRLAIPKRLRDVLGHPLASLVYLAPGTDGSLALYTAEAFLRLGQQLAQGSPTGHEVRTFARLFYAQAQCAEIDRQGRVRIPPELVRLASLGEEVVLLGVGDHLEVWDRRAWESYLEDKQPRYDEIAESAFQARPQPAAVPREFEPAGMPAHPK